MRCSHGTYHLTAGSATLHLSEDELSAIYSAANAAAQREPTLFGKMLLDEGLNTDSKVSQRNQ